MNTCARYMSKRYDKYLDLMKHVSHHIVEGYMIHRELTKRQEDRTAAKLAKWENRKVSYIPLSYPLIQHTRYITNEASIHDHQCHMKDNSIAVPIQCFLANA